MNKKRLLRYLPIAIGLVLVLVIAVVIYLFRDMFQKPVSTKKQVQQITVLQPPPPPPPPPPQEKPPEPEVQEEKIEEPPEPEPEQQAEEPPPGQDLGVDAEGGAGSDAFGLIGKKGGHGLLGGGGGNAMIYYGQQMQREVADALQRGLKDEARRKKYTVQANIWIGADGTITRAELSGSSGDAEVDAALQAALSGLRVRLKAPPENMPQPVKIRIRS